MDPQELPALIRKAKAGDRVAFDALAAACRPRLEAVVHTRMGEHLKRVFEVDDVVQETLLKASCSLERFQWWGEDSFHRWLGGIAEHVIRKLASRYEREHKLRLEHDPTWPGASPSQALRRDERFERLEKALAALSPEHRQVILLARVEGLRLKEVARRMRRSPDATARLLSRALRALRRTFGDTESLHLPPRSLAPEGGDDDGA